MSERVSLPAHISFGLGQFIRYGLAVPTDMTEDASTPKGPWILGILLALGFALSRQQPTISHPVAATPLAVPPTVAPASNAIAPPLVADLEMVAEEAMKERERLDSTIWADEITAQKYEDTFVDLWDRIRGSNEKFTVLGGFAFETLAVRAFGAGETLPHDVIRRRMTGEVHDWNSAEFKSWLAEQKASGLKIIQTEWHHRKFERGTNAPDRSVVSFSIHARSGTAHTRHVLAGEMGITWSATKNELGLFVPRKISVTGLELLTREGKPAFTEVVLPKRPPGAAAGMEMTLAADLNGDGLPDLAFPQINLVYWNRGDFNFEIGDLVTHLPGGVDPVKIWQLFVYIRAVAGDFTADGKIDLAMIVPDHGVFVYEGGEDGFNGPPIHAFRPRSGFAVPSMVSAGDLNGDGWLDLFVGQYRRPYSHGFMPQPFYDANNSDPGYLLINNGRGQFADRTNELGMSKKRNRFCYSASFVDLDDDDDLDLFTVNDFAGVDVFRNTGKGLEDISAEYLDERANFGMGHSLADFNNDAELDLYVTGMSSTTARRLESMGLERDDFPDISQMRMKMAYGNRMYLGNGERMRQPAFLEQVSRTGWAWGCAAFDFANNGTMDLYVANGHLSAGSCKDYCTRYWTHDIYAQHKSTNAVFRQLYMKEWERNSEMSWNGYEKNVLFANDGGTNFINIGFLLDMGFAYDSRCVVAEDFDLDGRMDLAVLERHAWSEGIEHRFHLYRNSWEQNGNWIGVKLRPAAGQTVHGAKIRITAADRQYVGVIVSGDSYRTQQSATQHFGIGATKSLKSIEIVWPGGRRQLLSTPAINQYHTVRPETVAARP